MSRRALDALLSLPEQARFIRGMVAWIGFRQVPFAYDRAERHAGETNYPLGKMVRLALDAVTGFSTAPLRLASHAGLLLTGASRSEEHTSELQSLMRISYAGFCLKKKKGI